MAKTKQHFLRLTVSPITAEDLKDIEEYYGESPSRVIFGDVAEIIKTRAARAKVALNATRPAR